MGKKNKKKHSEPQRFSPPTPLRQVDKMHQRVDEGVSALKQRFDGWTSALSGLGTRLDKRQYTSFVADGTNWIENIELWRGDDLAGRIVEAIPNEMIRQGWELCIEGQKDGADIVSEVTAYLEDYDLDNKLWQALCLERAVGGAGVVLGTNDLGELAEPLNFDQITSLNWVEVFEPIELQTVKWQRDPTLPKFGSPEVYNLQPNTQGGSTRTAFPVHESRILVFPGIRVTRRQVSSRSGWGDAVLTRCRETLRDFQTSWAAAGILVADFAQPVWKIKGLSEIISLDKDKELKVRIEMMELARHTLRAIVIDADAESWSREQTPLTGLTELMVQFATRLAASADTPVSLLMGTSPAGLNATGAFDIRTWYDRVAAQQKRKLKPALEKIIKVAFKVLEIEEPDSWYVKFHPLWQPTEKEMADTRLVQAQVDEKYITLGVASPDEIRKERFAGREYSADTHLEGELPTPDAPVPAMAQAPEYQAIADGAKKPDDSTDEEGEADEEEPPPPPPTRKVPVNAHERSIRVRGDGVRSDLLRFLHSKTDVRLDDVETIELARRACKLTEGGLPNNLDELRTVGIAAMRVARYDRAGAGHTSSGKSSSGHYYGSPTQLREIAEEEAFERGDPWQDDLGDDEWQDRFDEFNPDQERDDKGQFGSGGGGGKAAKEEKKLSPEHEKIAKAARGMAVEAQAHAKSIREKLKLDPTNATLNEAAKKADNIAKAARSSARKAEQAKDAKEAEKHMKAAAAKLSEAQDHAELHTKAAAPKAPSNPAPDSLHPIVGYGAAAAKAEALSGNAATASDHEKAAAAHLALKAMVSSPNNQKYHQVKADNHQAKAQELKAKADAAPPPPPPAPPTAPPTPVVAKTSLEKSAHAHSLSAPINALHLEGEAASKEQYAAAAAAHKEAHEVGVAAGFPNSVTTKGHATIAVTMQHKADNALTQAEKDAMGPTLKPISVQKFKEMRTEYTKELSAKEKSAALTYSGHAYTEINGALRKGKDHEITKHLDAAISKAKLDKDIVVFRGVSSTPQIDEMLGGLKVGDGFHDKAYLSTSTNLAASFGGQYKIHMTVPKGQHAAPIPSKHSTENEFLLPRGAQFKVTKIEKSSNGFGKTNHVIHMTMESSHLTR